jgi:hypothetical protein
MSSLLKVSPGMRPRFFSQKMAQKLPLKWMPSTQAKANSRCAKLSLLLIHLHSGSPARSTAAGQRLCAEHRKQGQPQLHAVGTLHWHP